MAETPPADSRELHASLLNADQLRGPLLITFLSDRLPRPFLAEMETGTAATLLDQAITQAGMSDLTTTDIRSSQLGRTPRHDSCSDLKPRNQLSNPNRPQPNLEAVYNQHLAGLEVQSTALAVVAYARGEAGT